MKKTILFFLITPFLVLSQQTIYGTFLHDGLNRDYIYYEPNNLQANAPLVFVAHGYTGSHTGIMNYCGMNDIADQNGFAVCYPKGTTDNQWGGSNFWNVGYDFHNGINVDDVGFIINLAQYLQLNYNLSSDNTFFTGMSNGGELSYLLACEAPGTFKAFAPVAGTIFPNGLTNNTCNASPIPIFEIHGSNDNVTLFEGDPNDTFWGPYLGIDSIINYWVSINGLSDLTIDTLPNLNNNNEYIISYKYSSLSSNNKVWLYKHKNGHNWDVDDIVVAQEIWDFFSLFLTSSTNVNDEFLNSNKKILKITDLLGRKINENKNQLSIYFYSNGSIEKKIYLK